MAGGNLKEIKAVLDLEVLSEMKKPQQAWFKENFSKNRKIQTWKYEKKAKVDPREWDAKKLSKALIALTRWEAVLFAGRAEEWMRKIEKAKDKDKVLKEALAKYPKYYDDIYKKMTLKVDKALEELAKGDGDNKESVKTGEGIFEKAKELDSAEVFTDPAEEVVYALEVFEKETGKASDDKGKEAAFSAAASSVRGIEGTFKGLYKAKAAIVKDINKDAGKMSKDKKSNEKMQKIGKDIGRLKSDTKKVLGDMASFQGDLKTLSKQLFDEKLEEKDLKEWMKKFAEAPKRLNAGSQLQGKLSGLKKTFSKQVKELEKK